MGLSPSGIPIFAQRKWDCPLPNNLGTIPIFAQRKQDCPLPASGAPPRRGGTTRTWLKMTGNPIDSNHNGIQTARTPSSWVADGHSATSGYPALRRPCRCRYPQRPCRWPHPSASFRSQAMVGTPSRPVTRLTHSNEFDLLPLLRGYFPFYVAPRNIWHPPRLATSAPSTKIHPEGSPPGPNSAQLPSSSLPPSTSIPRGAPNVAQSPRIGASGHLRATARPRCRNSPPTE